MFNSAHAQGAAQISLPIATVVQMLLGFSGSWERALSYLAPLQASQGGEGDGQDLRWLPLITVGGFGVNWHLLKI